MNIFLVLCLMIICADSTSTNGTPPLPGKYPVTEGMQPHKVKVVRDESGAIFDELKEPIQSCMRVRRVGVPEWLRGCKYDTPKECKFFQSERALPTSNVYFDLQENNLRYNNFTSEENGLYGCFIGDNPGVWKHTGWVLLVKAANATTMNPTSTATTNAATTITRAIIPS